MAKTLNIPGYQIQRPLEEGGMAMVYLAVQENLDRKVALKVMNAALANDKTFCDRFLNEGKIIAKLSNHEDIVTVYDIGFADNVYYMAMEFMEGGTLEEHLHGLVGVMQGVDIVRHIASALAYSHQQGIVHRDVKPANIMFRRSGAATLTDFGIAKTLSSEKHLTQLGFAVGTPEYMSPEQAKAKELDGRSDLYSLGIVFYELLTGKRPYTSDDSFTTAMMHINDPIPQLSDRFSEYQPIMNRLLEKQPEDRFESAEQFIAALDVVAGGGSYDDEYDRAGQTLIAKKIEEHSSKVSLQQEKKHTIFTKPAQVSALASVLAIILVVVVVLGYNYFWKPGVQTTGEEVSANTGITENEETGVSASQLSLEDQERVVRLLKVADAHKAIGRLKEPPGSNAYDAYKIVLSIDPNNREAKQGIKQIDQIGGQ